MRWALATALVAALGACSAARRDDVARCKAAETEMYAGATSEARVELVCSRAFRRTGSPQALLAATRSQVRASRYDEAVAAAAGARGEVAPRIWTLAGDAEAARGRHAESRAWYERALEAQRTREPRLAANIAARISDIEIQRGAIDEGIRYLHLAQSLAEAAGDAELRALTIMGLAQLLLGVGDVRAASAMLASMTAQVQPSASYYREYLAVAGEVDAAAGRPATAAASFELCVAPAPPPREDPGTQLRCHLGRAALALSAGGARDDEARRDIELAAGYLDATAATYGQDPDRAANVAWMRAQVDLRDPARAPAALAVLRDLAAGDLAPGTRSRVSFTIGHALVQRAPVEAERWFREAAAAIEGLRDGGAHREVRRSLPRELRAPYEALFVLRARAGDAAGALDAMEHALDRDFLDQLAASVAAADPGDGAIHEAERRVRAMRQLRARPTTRFVPAAAGGTMIGFFAAEDGLWRARVAGGAVQLTRIADLAALAPLVKAVRADPAAAQARELRERLLPEAALPPADEPLLIVPDPFLEGVRFAALPRGGRYLIERNPIVLAPTFAMATGAGVERPAQPLGPPVVLGDPDPVRQLPSARQEAIAVAALLGVEPRLGAPADRAAMIGARRASVLHVASHGSTRDDGTLLSLGDGDFGTADVLEHGIAPELVVVASCTSAATRPDAMWTSVAAAFVASGSPAVVGATASIPDAEARDIVIDLHRHAREVDPARALARALRGAIARKAPIRSWSAFAVLGRLPRAAVNE